jgi:hypothetical protein
MVFRYLNVVLVQTSLYLYKQSTLLFLIHMFESLQKSFKSMSSNKGGQMNLVGLVIGAIVAFIVLSLGITLTNNFYIATGQTPQFNSLWPLAIAAVIIIVVIVAGLGGIVHGG